MNVEARSKINDVLEGLAQNARMIRDILYYKLTL